MVKKIKKWEPDDFELEMTTHWSFPNRGNWATHDAKWRGNWSPYIPRNIILRYSQEGDLVLDQFVGGGTTLVEAKLLNRNIIGVDVNGAKRWIDIKIGTIQPSEFTKVALILYLSYSLENPQDVPRDMLIASMFNNTASSKPAKISSVSAPSVKSENTFINTN